LGLDAHFLTYLAILIAPLVHGLLDLMRLPGDAIAIEHALIQFPIHFLQTSVAAILLLFHRSKPVLRHHLLLVVQAPQQLLVLSHRPNALAQWAALLCGLLDRVASAFRVPRHIARTLARLIRRLGQL
jgi:hypothetical protein